ARVAGRLAPRRERDHALEPRARALLLAAPEVRDAGQQQRLRRRGVSARGGLEARLGALRLALLLERQPVVELRLGVLLVALERARERGDRVVDVSGAGRAAAKRGAG